MDEARFKALAEAYGADVERWPVAERDAARRRLADAGPDARAALKEAAALDALLKEAPQAHLDARLIGRVMADAQARVRPRPSAVFGGGAIALSGFGARAGLIAACLALVSVGVAAGWTTSHGVVASAAGDALIASAYGETSEDMFAVEEL